MSKPQKTILMYSILAIISVFILFLPGCMIGTSPDMRINKFVSDLNKAPERGLYANFHYEMPGWDTWDDATFSTTEFGASLPNDYQPFSITITTPPTDSSIAGVKYAIGLLSSGHSAISPQTIRINLKEQTPGDWYILAISLPDVPQNLWGTFTF